MSQIFTEFEAKKQELSCNISVLPIILYFEKLYGKELARDYIESIGLSINYLKGKSNWVSYKYYCALLDKLVEVTDDEKAPFNAVFSTSPYLLFSNFFYATYSSLYFTTPISGYKLILSKSFSERYSKNGYFELIGTTKNSITVKDIFYKGFKQTKNNCLAIQGFLSAPSISWGLPPAKVEHIECELNGAEHCIYKIEWENQVKDRKLLLIPLIFIPIIFIEKFFLNSMFKLEDIIITGALGIISYCLLKVIKYKTQIQNDKVFNYEKNNSIIESMEKIEKDYKEILDIKQRLEERNIFLNISNKLNQTIAATTDFNNLNINVMDILIRDLFFYKGALLQYNNDTDTYYPIVERSLADVSINYSGITLLPITSSGYNFEKATIISKKDFIEKFNLTENFIDWLSDNNKNIINIIPVNASKTYRGFFIFMSDSFSLISQEIMISIFDNITNQFKIALERIFSIAIIENILSSIPSYVLIFSSIDDTIVYSNQILINDFEKLTGNKYPFESNKKLILFDIIPFSDDVKIKVKEYIKKNNYYEKSENYETKLGNNTIEYNMFSIPQYKDEDKLFGIILNDITETKIFDQKLLLNEKLISLGKVASGIAHEINNPLYAVLANAEEIADSDTVNTEIKGYANEIVEYVLNVSNIIKDLSSYSKTLRTELYDEIDLNDVIEESLKIIRYSADFKNFIVNKDYKDIPLIKAAKGEMEQIFINLIKNSFQAMGEKGTLTIDSIYDNNQIQIRIIDTGEGIPLDKIPYIFNLYYTTKKEGEGTGFGLYVVKKIITKYNGSIDVESEYGKGTIFTVKFKV